MSDGNTTMYKVYREGYYLVIEGPNCVVDRIYPSMVLTDDGVKDVMRHHEKTAWMTTALLNEILAEIPWLREQAELDPFLKK